MERMERVNKWNSIATMENDNECYTTMEDADKLVKFLKPYLDEDTTIWMPFDTEDSNIYKAFINEGFHKLIITSILTGTDFYKYEPDDYDLIISNPPFSGRTKLFKRLKMLNKPFIILQATQMFNNSSVIRFLTDNPDVNLLMPKRRMTFLRYDSEAGVIEQKSAASFYSFWVAYKLKHFLGYDTFIDLERI